ncbi:MAG: hypothetical protein A2Z25_10725 [Planctomycetes bacterium RBG_16_55_9]|nr:MAG: hypothetical protein A2Z25_10725 [Planctomycetes bacterium RBG_16_55_9]
MVVQSGGPSSTATPLWRIQITASAIALFLGLTDVFDFVCDRIALTYIRRKFVDFAQWIRFSKKKPACGVFSCLKKAILIYAAMPQ